MANPFFVQPAQYGPALQQAAGAVEEFGQKQYMDRAKAAMAEAVQSGNPGQMAQVASEFPEVAETMGQIFGFTNDQTKQVATETYRRFLSSQDPAERQAILEGGIETVQQFGGTPRNMLKDLETYRRDPEGAINAIKMGYAGADPQGYAAAFGGGADTPSSVREYQFFQSLTPEEQEQYQAVKRGTKTVNIGGVEYLPLPDGTLKPMTIQTTGGAQEVTPESTAQTKATIAGAEEQAKQDVKAQSPEQQRKTQETIAQSRMNIAGMEDVVGQADRLLENQDYIDRLTGIRGAAPAIPGTMGFDAEIAFDRLKNTLTLGNLDKMSGVLSESDIQILQSAAGGLEAGMSEESFKERLKEIRSVFANKTKAERDKLKQLMGGQTAEGEQGQTSGNQTPTTRIRLDAEGNIIQ